MLLLSGCTKSFDNHYTFPENGLEELVQNDSALKLSGFASELCVPEEDADLNTDGVNACLLYTSGDAVVTSSLSTKFLPGILIGYASDINIDSQHLTKSGKLIPVADFEKIKEVLIITTIKTDSGLVDTGVGEVGGITETEEAEDIPQGEKNTSDDELDIDISSEEEGT